MNQKSTCSEKHQAQMKSDLDDHSAEVQGGFLTEFLAKLESNEATVSLIMLCRSDQKEMTLVNTIQIKQEGNQCKVSLKGKPELEDLFYSIALMSLCASVMNRLVQSAEQKESCTGEAQSSTSKE